MLIIGMMMLLPLIITTLLILINFIVSIKMFKDREKPSPYECGFTPLTEPRLPFSIQFFLIGMIFLIFDIEIILLMPFIAAIYMNLNLYQLMMTFLIVFICLLIGLIYEWNEQSVIWIK
uniref:NADH-ubiquinone oxidoreductase chain 3 n=1 Tax=Parapolybia nodosa TaxID=2592910 RepID=A0A514CQS1_9HYME|nr:NADH dehydrogenase subunit 3 [Parapolybia nodosa]